ncbi:hypothetical protein CkaCkLH20_11590 [Colletotrichum karsti]|uniref:SnoaL-like domain-containing protein n=1 Tax=Colletotrichum karsti TaxID=1095194 RepID=A0A9P6HUE9_9PEZI|nr:uncharacterized protein CkaCkLH20_11590 [Colletotrichum karsti]KAF9870918.1 hypothetical protein CkaCkLH20_11590 [Colletotrichum karsti]
MPTTYDSEAFRRYRDEIAGSDRSLRFILYDRARDLIHNLAAGNSANLMDWVTDDVTLVTDLDAPGNIYKGKKELLHYFDNDDLGVLYHWHEGSEEVPTLLIVDRGRITCHLERLRWDSDASSVERQHVVATFDLNDESRIKRIEYRLLQTVHDKEGRTLEEAISETNERVVHIDKNAYF